MEVGGQLHAPAAIRNISDLLQYNVWNCCFYSILQLPCFIAQVRSGQVRSYFTDSQSVEQSVLASGP